MPTLPPPSRGAVHRPRGLGRSRGSLPSLALDRNLRRDFKSFGPRGSDGIGNAWANPFLDQRSCTGLALAQRRSKAGERRERTIRLGAGAPPGAQKWWKTNESSPLRTALRVPSGSPPRCVRKSVDCWTPNTHPRSRCITPTCDARSRLADVVVRRTKGVPGESGGLRCRHGVSKVCNKTFRSGACQGLGPRVFASHAATSYGLGCKLAAD